MQRAAAHLVDADPAFAPIVARSPSCTIGDGSRAQQTPFASLVRSVIAQQLSTKAADVITERFVSTAGEVTPARILALDDDVMRSAGLSRAKVRTIAGLAGAFHHDDLDDAIATGDDHTITAELTRLWGIGRWTVEMFLIFDLHRLDVWPVGDLAMRRGWQHLHAEVGDIDPRELDSRGDVLAPYRSVAAWYCWRVVDGDNPTW